MFATDAEGGYAARSVMPRFDPIPDDGPVGRMLVALGGLPSPAAHVYVIVTAPGVDPVITYFLEPNCRYLAGDAVFGVKQSLIADFVQVSGADADAFRLAGFDELFWWVR